MANFEPIVEWLLYQEDDHKNPGAIKNLGDQAGLTRLGVTSKNFGTVLPAAFWTPAVGFTLAVGYAKKLYQDQFWHHINGERINNDEVAALLFSASVNLNIPPAVKLMQEVLGVQQDGVLGLVSIAELNSKDPASVVRLFRAAWEDHYHQIAIHNPSYQQFLAGWLNRVDFPYPSPLVGNLYA